MPFTFIPTHSSDQPSGRWKPWLKSFRKILQCRQQARRSEEHPIAFIHMGGGAVSTLRKATLSVFLRLLRVGVIVQLHGPEVENYFAHRLSRIVFRLCLSPAQAIAVLTPWWADLLERNGVKAPIHVLPNVVPEAAETEAASPVNDKEIGSRCRVLTMSRMVPGKGFDAVVECMSLVTEPCTFLFAGTGPQEPELRRRVAALQTPHEVAFLGWVEDPQKPELFAQADIFCLPSQYDSFGMGYIEAMSYGLPVIALRLGAIADVVGDGDAGVLVEANDPQSLAQAIDQLLSDPARRELMRYRAKARVVSQYTAPVISLQLKKICSETI